MLIFDAHLDLSMNAIEWNRDITRPVAEVRQREQGRNDKVDRGTNTVCLPDMRRGHVGLCVATQIARYVKQGNPLPGYHSPEIAYGITQAQLAWYQAMCEKGEMVHIKDAAGLRQHLELWLAQPGPELPIGFILSLEGADSIRSPEHLQRHWDQGLRVIGPAHYGPGTYAQGTHVEGSMGEIGKKLLREMERIGFILDATHLCDTSFWEAMDNFGGPVWASHSNCRALVPDQRQFADDQIQTLIDRGAVIGAALDAWMMIPGWIRGKTKPKEAGVRLEHMVDHMDHICQMAGNSLHSAIGTDLDGGFGLDQSPSDLDTIADLQRVPELLSNRGYKQEDIENICHRNWIRFLLKAWG